MAEIVVSSKQVTFLFNFIVTHVEMPKVDNPEAAVILIKLGKAVIKITSSRINVTEFSVERGVNVPENPDDLRKTLETQSLEVTVKYRGGTLGAGEFTFPESFTAHIQTGMNDLLHSQLCHIYRREEYMGFVEILCMLTIKCEEEELPQEPCAKPCRNLGKSLNEADIMFLFGQQDPCPDVCEPCVDELVPDEGDTQLDLDLSRYKRPNQRMTIPPVCEVSPCTQLKNVTRQFGEFIDSIAEKVRGMPSKKVSCSYLESSQPRQANVKYVDRSIPVPLGDIEELGIKPIRFCPICLTSISFQPKYGCCPKCFNIARPDLEMLTKKEFTADEILDEFLKPAPPQKFDENGQLITEHIDKPKKCECKEGVMCTHCRIRNIFLESTNMKNRIFTKCPVVEPGENDDFCIVVQPSHPNMCVPHLERVFDELRELYRKRDDDREAMLVERKQSMESSGRHSRMQQMGVSKGSGEPSFMHRASTTPKVGHKTCLKQHGIVSRRHGWAWPSTYKARRLGWRPGAICRYAGSVMRFFLTNKEGKTAFSICKHVEDDESRKQPVILNICKRDGAIYITLNGIRSPHIEMKPIVFKIVKSDLALALRQIKNKLKRLGFRKCVCHNTVMMCVCRDIWEKKCLERALQKECRQRHMVNCVDQLVLTDTSESEMEYSLNVTPPLPMARPVLAIKPRTATVALQTDGQDLNVPLKYPLPLDPYWRAYDCAVGDRYTGTAFGMPGEEVFEDGLFGHGGGGAHGPSAVPGGKAKPPGIWGAGAGGPIRGSGRGPKPTGTVDKGGSPLAGKSFPGLKYTEPKKKTPPIPVRMPKKHYDDIKKAEQQAKQAAEDAVAKRKQGIDLIKYLREDGAIPKLWDPNEPQPKQKVTTRTGLVVGTDGLTDAQRKRKSLNQICPPPFERLAKLGKGIDPCGNCYQMCGNFCCYC